MILPARPERSQGLGLELSSAIRLFLRQMVAENGLPFRPSFDPLYSKATWTPQALSCQPEAGNVASLSLEELARLSHLSVSQFKQKFRAQVGMAPRHYVNYHKNIL